MHYDRTGAQRIIEAYREIFPRITPELASYWDTARTRPWSYLTSDFHRATLEKYESFSTTVERLVVRRLVIIVGHELADAVRAHQSIEQRTLGGIPLLVPNSARC